MKLKVLVADDSAIFRRVLVETLASLPDVEVIGSVANGKLALQRVRELEPDLLTLDMEMPETDGLAVLDGLRQSGAKVAVIVVSALTRQGGHLTLRALEKGAFDFITKPDTAGADQSREVLRRELAPRVRALASRLEIRSILRHKPQPATKPAAPTAPTAHGSPSLRPGLSRPATPPTALEGIAGRMNRLVTPGRPEIVLIGVSTGGPNALASLMPALPGDLGVPLFIVQHMPPIFTQSLAESLDAKCALEVREAVAGETAQANTAYIAPGGRQLRVHVGTDGGKLIQVTDDPPENNCRPAVDYLFRSVANQFPGRALAIILTGMGSDGTLGLRLLKRQGCFVIAQDEASSVIFGMPRAAIEAGVVDVVLPLNAIAARITSIVRGAKF